MEYFAGFEIKETETADSGMDILLPNSKDENGSGRNRFQVAEADSGRNLETVEENTKKIRLLAEVGRRSQSMSFR